jgi:hypothetical protein
MSLLGSNNRNCGRAHDVAGYESGLPYVLRKTMPGKTSAPDKIWTLSWPQQRGDEMKISSGASQSPRGDESIKIVQYSEPGGECYSSH